MPLSQSEQKFYIYNLISAPLKEGDTWYLVAIEWYSIWEQYVENEESVMNPGPIKNDSIISVDNPSQLKRNLIEQQDYVLLHQKAYDVLVECYGGGPPLPRKVISFGSSSHAALQIEIYPILVNIFTCVDNMNNETVTNNSDSNMDDDITTTGTTTTTSTITGSVCNTPLMKYYMSIKDSINDVLSLLSADHSKYSKEEDVRIWIRIPDEDQDSFNNSRNNGNKNKNRNNNGNNNDIGSSSIATSTASGVSDPIITDDDKKSTTTTTITTTSDIVDNKNNNSSSTLLTSKAYQQSLQQQQQQLTPLQLLTGKKLTTDKTDVDTEGGYWRFFRLDRTTTTLSTILGGFKILDLLVEVEVKSADGTLEYPRSHILNKWRQFLKVGDIVDAIDEDHKWYEAQILSISSTDGSMKTHYFGWHSKFDTIVLQHEVNRRIQPLYSHSRNWRVELEVDDQIEVKVVNWFQGTITKVNDINNTIEVLIVHRDMKKVYNVYSEDICPMYTHIKKPANITTNISSKRSALALSTNITTSTSVVNAITSKPTVSSTPATPTVTVVNDANNVTVVNVTATAMSDRLLNIGFVEGVRAGNPLAGLFITLTAHILFQDAMDHMLADCTPDQISNEYKVLLRIYVELAMDCAKEDIYSNPAVAAADMTVDEIAAIKMYTMAAEPPESGLYHILNKALREQNRNKLKPFVKILWLLMQALRKAQTCSRPVVYRGVKLDLSNQYRVGQTVTWQGFTSTTTTIAALSQDMFLGTNGRRTLFTIELTTGRARMISSLSMTAGENEVLLPPNSRFEVEAILGPTADGLFTVQLKEIEPIDPILRF